MLEYRLVRRLENYTQPCSAVYVLCSAGYVNLWLLSYTALLSLGVLKRSLNLAVKLGRLLPVQKHQRGLERRCCFDWLFFFLLEDIHQAQQQAVTSAARFAFLEIGREKLFNPVF